MSQPFLRLFAVDPSLTCSGWALFELQNSELISVGKIKGPPVSAGPLATRLSVLQQRVKSLFRDLQLNETDVVVCESATTMKDPRAVVVLEQVRGIFEVLARETGAVVPGRIHPRSVQFEVIGLNGHQLERKLVKDAACAVASRLYSEALGEFGLGSESQPLRKHQDIVDAALLGHLALGKIRRWQLSDKLPLETFFHDKKVNARGISR